MNSRVSVPVDGDWVWEYPPDDGIPTSLDSLARGEVCVRDGAWVEALRQFGVALLLEPSMPRAQLGAALALDGIGDTQRARLMLSVDGLAERLGIQGLLAGLELASNRSWAPEAVAFIVQAYRLRPSWRELAALDELATKSLDAFFPEIAVSIPPEARPTRGLRAGRNDPCPCGSGKKYKRCHLKADQEAARGPAVRGEADNLVIIATVHERDGAWGGASALWEYLAERYSESAIYWARLGRARLKLEQLRPALAAFERLDRFPVSRWEDAVVDRARCLHELGRHRDALRCLDTRPKVAIRSAAALVLRAAILGHLGRMAEARDELLRAHRLDPSRADYLVQLAEAHQLLGDFPAAGEAALAALTQSAIPADTTTVHERLDLRLSAASILAGLGWESQLVLDVCAEVLGAEVAKDVRIQALSVRAYALLTLNRPSETAASVEEALQVGENVELHLLGAAAASQLGDSEARITYLREGVRCLEEDQGADADELAVGGLIAATLGLFERALPLADRALAADPESAVAVPVRAHCLLRLDRAPQALAFADTRRTAEISSPLLVLTRAEALVRLGRYEDALNELRGPLPLDTGPLAPLLRQLQEVQPEERRDLLRARALRELGRDAEAREILGSLTDKNPSYREAWQDLAQLWLNRGEAIEAHRALLRAEHLDPSNSWVRERLAYVEGMLRVAQAERVESEALVTRMIGRKAWLTLGEDSRLALVSSEVSWRQLRGVEAPGDYGPPVGQAARAVELELQRRLFSPFREYVLRSLGRDGLQRIAQEETASALLPFLRFLRAPHGGLSLGPMLGVADALLSGDLSGPAVGLLRRYIESAYASPTRVRELLADPELAVLNATRNQGLHRATVGFEAASRCRAFVLGDAAGRGWLTAMTQLLIPRMVDRVLVSPVLTTAPDRS